VKIYSPDTLGFFQSLTMISCPSITQLEHTRARTRTQRDLPLSTTATLDFRLVEANAHRRRSLYATNPLYLTLFPHPSRMLAPSSSPPSSPLAPSPSSMPSPSSSSSSDPSSSSSVSSERKRRTSETRSPRSDGANRNDQLRTPSRASGAAGDASV
jgi:hypothetical protein